MFSHTLSADAKVCAFTSKEDRKFYNFSSGPRHCFLCRFDGDQTFILRGLCSEQELVDVKYIFLHTSISHGRLSFRGLSGKTNITYDSSSKTWAIVRHVPLEANRLNIVGTTTAKYFPLGAKFWTMSTNCSAELVNRSKISQRLKLTKVSSWLWLIISDFFHLKIIFYLTLFFNMKAMFNSFFGRFLLKLAAPVFVMFILVA